MRLLHVAKNMEKNLGDDLFGSFASSHAPRRSYAGVNTSKCLDELVGTVPAHLRFLVVSVFFSPLDLHFLLGMKKSTNQELRAPENEQMVLNRFNEYSKAF